MKTPFVKKWTTESFASSRTLYPSSFIPEIVCRSMIFFLKIFIISCFLGDLSKIPV